MSEQQSRNESPIKLTDEQIEVLRNRLAELVQYVVINNIKTVFFLDSSARPLARIFQELWHNNFGNKELPAIKFLNIGRDKPRLVAKYIAEAARNNQLPTDFPQSFIYMSQMMDASLEVIEQSKKHPEEYSPNELSNADMSLRLMQDTWVDKIDEILQSLSDEALNDIFGKENLNQLKKMIASTDQEDIERFIIDDVESSGLTIAFTNALFKRIDPSRWYHVEAVLEHGNTETKAPFSQVIDPQTGATEAYMLWAKHNFPPPKNRPIIVTDNPESRSFVSIPEQNPDTQKAAKALYKYLIDVFRGKK